MSRTKKVEKLGLKYRQNMVSEEKILNLAEQNASVEGTQNFMLYQNKHVLNWKNWNLYVSGKYIERYNTQTHHTHAERKVN